MNKPIKCPNILGKAAKDLLEGLLRLNPEERLGFKRGIIEVKEHEFFNDIDWKAIE
jgi:hypothetical protein